MKKVFYIFLFLIFLGNVAISQQSDDAFRRLGTNINYELDDWVTYSMTRWITSLAEGREYVYFGTSGGIARYNFYANSWERPWTVSDGLPDNFIVAVAYDINTDYIWCSTHLGVSVFRTSWKRWENYFKEEFGLFPGDDIVSIGFDNEHVWLESRDGEYFKSNNQQITFFKETGSLIPYGKITWFGKRATASKVMPQLYMQGGYFFDPSGVIKDYQLDDYPVTCFLQDQWNMIWIGSWGVGAGKADSRIKILELLPYGLFIKNVTAFEMDKNGNIWAGGKGSYNGQSGITFWDIDNNQVEYYQARFENNMYSDQVTSIAIDYPYIWFGTEFGLVRFNKEENEWKTYDTGLGLRDNFIYDVEVDNENVWIGTLLGLCRLEKDNMYEKGYRIQNVAPADIKNMKVYDIEIMENLLWIGTEYGVYVYDKTKQTGEFEDEPDGPQNNEVTAVAVLGESEVWFGMSDGIEVYDMQTKSWKGVPERRFFNSTYVNYIVVDDSAAWVATDHGVLKYDKAQNRWRTFDIEDGLASNLVNHIVLDGDYVWFGTSEGLTRFYWNSPYRID